MRIPFSEPTSRRRFLKVPLLIGLLAPARAAGGPVIGPAASKRDPLASLPAFLDTLLPPEDGSPSATALGIHRRLPGAFPGRSRRRLLMRGCTWLDDTARRRGGAGFADLGEVERNAIVAATENAPRNSLPRVFFEEVRRELFRLYYADARSWAAFGYGGPPQPAGFPDHEHPPSPIGEMSR
jgi:hypothetical protein